MWKACQKYGLDARIFAEDWNLTEPEVNGLSRIRKFLTNPENTLICHYSRGWKAGLDLLRQVKCRTVVKYHNFSPSRLVDYVAAGHDERNCAESDQIKDLAAADCDIYLANSNYDREELLFEGIDEQNCFVVSPFHHIEQLHEIEADLTVLDRYRDGLATVLTVGRVAPHKGHAALIEAFAAYHHDYNSSSRFLIVGKKEAAFKTYSSGLRDFIASLWAEKAVAFIDDVSDSALKSYYLLSSVFLTASQLEGFNVRTLEAMSMKVPVVAYASGVISETVGEAGFVFREPQSYLMAEAMDRLIRDEGLNAELGLKASKRYEQHFSNKKNEAALFKVLGELE
jgi:glycosyltransferase involved in cell wall biosynthesis